MTNPSSVPAVLGLHAQDVPGNVGAQLLAAHPPLGGSLDERAALGGNRALTGAPLVNGGGGNLEPAGHGGFPTDEVAGTSHGLIHAENVALLSHFDKRSYRTKRIALLMVWSKKREADELAKRFAGIENRAEFARLHDIPGGAAMIYQHITGLRPIGQDAAVAYSRAFKVPLEQISPRIAKEIQDITQDFDVVETEIPSFSRGTAEPTVAHGLSPILAWEHEDDLPPGEFVMVPRLDVHLSAGGGRDQVEIELGEKTPIAFRADWVRKSRLKPNKLAAMTASGRSMEPTIHDGDSLIVDISQTDVQDGMVYALWYDGGERVKRLFRLPGGGLRIKSDNPEHGAIELGADYPGHVRIIGRVVHRSGTGGL